MRSTNLKATLRTAVLAVTVLLLGTSVAFGQQQVNLTAGPTTATMPDGSRVPMWGYSCTGPTTIAASTATCAPLNPKASGSWSPVVITVPTGQGLTINLTNNLLFTAGTGTNTVPTSLVIVGQLGGGLGTTATSTPSPDHTNAQPLTWPIAGTGPGVPPVGVGTPPTPQPDRVRSFSTEVAYGPTTATALTWPAASLRPGTYLIESGTHPSIQGPMGLYGILVVTTAPSGTTPGTAYPGVTYAADVPLLLSEIDPVQNNAVNAAVSTAGFSETMVWSGQPGGCGNPTSATYHQCYPPAVNYTPLYYMINGAAFDKTNSSASLFPASPGTAATPVSGSVLVRLVNAGLRMHVPAIVGSVTGTASAGGFSLIAEDGNPLPGLPRVQSEVFLAAGKTYDVMINAPAAGGTALPVFDRQLSLSGNATARDAGMLAYIGINGAGLPSAPAFAVAIARADTYGGTCGAGCTPLPGLVAGQTLVVSDPAQGVIANDTNVSGVALLAPPTNGTVTLSANGTFTYVPSGTATSDSFTYCANGSVTGATCSSGIIATVTLSAASIEGAGGIHVGNKTYTSNVAGFLSIKPSGVLSTLWDACTPTVANPCHDRDDAGHPLTVAMSSGNAPVASAGLTLTADTNGDGGFTASVVTPGTYSFTYKAQNSQGTVSSARATVTLVFPTGSGLAVSVVDGGDKKTSITDYRWIIEEDRTFYIDPKCTTNPPPAGCPGNSNGSGIVPTFGTNFHTSYMPVVATGCTGPVSCESLQTVLNPATGAHVNAVCDIGNGVCRADTIGNGQTAVMPGQVHLDPTKRYYISVLPGDAADPFNSATQPSASPTGHGMGGAPIAAGQTAVTVLAQPTPFPPAKLSVFVFEDDFPLNGENDAGGGALGGGDVGLPANEPGLGGFNITLFDDAGGTGDATGQMTYDMFNMPLSNSLAGTIDPATGLDACPISKNSLTVTSPTGTGGTTTALSPTGITGTIVTCPRYESDGKTFSPLTGQAVVANLMPGRYGVVATPGADRIGVGEEWLQTNTLDGQKAHDSFLRIGEPSYFQEFGPAGYHVAIGFANPAIINSRLPGVCAGATCTSSVTGTVTTERMSRTPDERLYSSGDNSSFAFTQCYVSLGDPDGEDFAFTKCDSNGNFTLSGLPNGTWRITIFDQWNDMLVDGLSTPVALTGQALNMGQIAINQWQANIYTSTFFDANGNGVRDGNETGLSLVPTNIRFRDGSFSNFNNTDLSGNAGFNEVFPLFSWYVIETDSTRYKNTGTHVVYDAGGPSDGSTCGGTTGAVCGNSQIGHFMANTAEQIPVPSNLRVPGAYYCTTADCADAPAPLAAGGTGGSTGRVDPPWVLTEGWQGFSGQNSFLEFGKTPYALHENGGIKGHVVYASTRPFDDPQLLLQTSWEPLVPHVTINLYQEATAPDGSISLKLVDTTRTSSFDDWAQGFRSDGIPNMNCPGQGRNTGTDADLFFFSLFNQPNYLDLYNQQHATPGTFNATATGTSLPANSQFKCYDGMHNWNQLQPAPYDGMYQFPSVTSMDPTTGKPTGTNCTACVPNPDTNDHYRAGTPMLPSGKYVVEVVVPPGYELVKEEDKNILIGDVYIAPVTMQFGGLGNIFIMPDQAAVSTYNANNAQNPTQNLGRIPNLPSHEGDTGSIETYWPCVGQSRIVPDYISLFPQSKEVSPFAGATRNLCDRKEVTLTDQASALAKFYIFTSTHAAAHFTGVITDDFTSEFDPFSPQFGEKFAPPNLPISIKDWTGNEVSRVYTDHWGAYNGLNYSTWEVNPPNPTGYAPTMMVTCMNDPGTGPTPDPLYNPAYSQFCYEIPFMPGQTQYMDTPVVPTSAFAGAGYNNPDCSYPDATPSISEVDGDGVGPWIAASGTAHPITIHSLGIQQVPNNAYSGPSATTAPYSSKTIARNFGFGTAAGKVTIGTVTATIVSWSDSTIVVTLPSTGTQVAACGIQQQLQYVPSGTTTARCGELAITAANGKQSVDTVTVTIGGKAPTHVLASASIQSAIDAAKPGDLIIIDPTCTTAAGPVACTTAGATKSNVSHNEMLLMWKPVRLQGVGAATTIINANAHPAGKLDPWRRQVNCLFGLTLTGTAISSTNPYDPTSTFTCTPAMQFMVDRTPLEAIIGWDASLNGNLPEQLQEPSLMGAYEGAGITVLAKGVKFPAGQDPLAETFPTGTLLLTGTTSSNNGCGSNTATAHNPFPTNFQCNPSRIDGLSITNSSQGGGGIFVHAWAHNLEISNNRVHSNSGTLAGGISVGQGEFAPQYLFGSATNAPPGSCVNTGLALNQQQPYCFNTHVNLHNNAVTLNSSLGDELFSATPSGAGGVAFCTGADYYKFNYNWVCGNLSTGDGAGIAHMGFSWNGDIEHNSILFNQSTNPTIPTNGGGIAILGAPDTDPVCGPDVGVTADADCAPGTSDGTGPGLLINANLIMGNAAESGSGGGIRLHGVNGTEVTFFPSTPSRWYSVSITNNIIANNVAGLDGAGLSLQDALAVNIVNNTIVSNDTTASAGILFNTLGAPLSSSPGSNCVQPGGTTSSCPQPAGLVAIGNSPTLTTTLAAYTLTCPAGHSNCKNVSYPNLFNNVFWQNRSFYIGVGPLGGGTINQQNVVTLYNAFTGTLPASQTATGACPAGSSYWDIGVRGDTGPGNHASGYTLAPQWSVLTNALETGAGSHNQTENPLFTSQYCNGSRIPPEFGGTGYQVPPGIADATVPNPLFSLLPSATVDEGNNWVNISWGPLAMANPTTGATLGNFTLPSTSPAIDHIPTNEALVSGLTYPTSDFFGNPRPDPALTSRFDVGAIEFQGKATGQKVPVLTGISPATGVRGTTVSVTLTGTGLTDVTGVNGGDGINVTTLNVISDTMVTALLQIPSTAALTTTAPISATDGVTGITSNNVNFTVTAPPTPTLTSITPNTGVRGTSVPVTLNGANLTGATAVTVSGGNVTVSGITVNAAGTQLTATFTIARGAALSARNVTVTTAAVAASNAETFTVLGATPTFTGPTPALNTGGTSTKNGTVTVTNTATGATAGPLTLTAAPTIAKVGAAGGTFSITAGGTCVSGKVVAPGASCTILVRYAPGTSTATATAHVTIAGTGIATTTVSSANFTAN